MRGVWLGFIVTVEWACVRHAVQGSPAGEAIAHPSNTLSIAVAVARARVINTAVSEEALITRTSSVVALSVAAAVIGACLVETVGLGPPILAHTERSLVGPVR